MFVFRRIYHDIGQMIKIKTFVFPDILPPAFFLNAKTLGRGLGIFSYQNVLSRDVNMSFILTRNLKITGMNRRCSLKRNVNSPEKRLSIAIRFLATNRKF